MNERFSKSMLANALWEEREAIAKEFHFILDKTGTAQLDGVTDQKRILAYGRIMQIENLIDRYNLR